MERKKPTRVLGMQEGTGPSDQEAARIGESQSGDSKGRKSNR